MAEWAVAVGGSNDREYFEDESSEKPTKTAFGPPTTTDLMESTIFFPCCRELH